MRVRTSSRYLWSVFGSPSVALKSWKSGEHEVVEVVVRRQYEPYDKLPLREPSGRTLRWTVLTCDQDPHGWRLTAIRCLPGCQEYHRKR